MTFLVFPSSCLFSLSVHKSVKQKAPIPARSLRTSGTTFTLPHARPSAYGARMLQSMAEV